MYGDKRILAIIPARGGSKGLPKKNIKKLCGKPLVCWTIDQALGSQYVDRVFVSTDCKEIADICERTCGINIESLRPKKLAEDNTSSAEVIRYTLEYLGQRGEAYDYLILLEPTSPLRKDDDIDNVIQLACQNPNCDGVICELENSLF